MSLGAMQVMLRMKDYNRAMDASNGCRNGIYAPASEEQSMQTREGCAEADQLLSFALSKGLKTGASICKLLYGGYAKANTKDLVDRLMKCMDAQVRLPCCG
ncbi:hypothetical protein IHE45_19G117100 [Dioscorea alata]|uniref:Uncharacterized protein n=1 Tax=Dioscorea alata TaxID=55571 RepID=A0ACB7U187_DIOAL|nr:hypothetical protein IHE45_19G117100 [Dioscorea alata]